MSLIPITMPVLGFDQDAGRIAAWLRQLGDHVEAGDPLLEIETEKATVEVTSTATGALVRIVAEPGAEVPVGSVIAWLDDDA